jgi:Guanyl-specific ribonuclease Sa
MKRNQTSLVSIVLVVLLALFGGSQVLNDNAAPASTGPIIEPTAIAAYLFEHGKLPDNFITKKEAESLGWDSRKNHVSDVAPGKSIGGDHYGNYEKLLPMEKGRTWQECDCNYVEGPRNAYRICFSNDGLVYYSDDHYKSFTPMEAPEK